MLGQTRYIEAAGQYVCGLYCKNRFKAGYYIDGYRLDKIQDVKMASVSEHRRWQESCEPLEAIHYSHEKKKQ